MITKMKSLKNWSGKMGLTILLVAGLCGCDDWIDDWKASIDVANLSGTWQKEYPKDVQTEGFVTWTFTEGGHPFLNGVLTIHVSDVFAGDSDVRYYYNAYSIGYPLLGGQSELYLYEMDHDWSAENPNHFKPTVFYHIEKCTANKLVLKRIEINVDGPNLIEGDVTFNRVK